MKRIFKNHDINFNLDVNNFPINFNLIKRIDFKFYTTNPLTFFSKTEKDVNKQNTIILASQDLDKLNEGVLYYDYQLVLIDSVMPDKTFDTVGSVMSDFYLANGNHMDEPVTESQMRWGKISGDIHEQHDLMNEFDERLSYYYTKEDIEDKKYLQAKDIECKLDKAIYEKDKPTFATKIDVAKDYVTKSELAGKNYITEHQNLDHLATKAELATYAKEADIPTKISQLTNDAGYITSLEGMATEEWVEKKGYLTQHQSLANYALKGDIPTKISQLYNDKNYVEQLQLKQYFTKEETLDVLDEHLMGVDAPKLSNYYRKEETYNRDEVDAAIKRGAANIDLTVFYTKSQIDGKGFLTEHQSLNHMLSKVEATQTYQPLGDYVTNKMLDARGFLLPVDLVDYARLGDIPTLTSQLKNDSGFLNTNSLLEYAKKIWVSDEIDRRLKDVRVDLSDYYTRAEIDGFKFATQDWVTNTIQNSVNLTNYYTKAEIDGQTEVMKGWVQNEIKSTADLTNYYTKKEIDKKIGGIDELLDYLNGEVI